MGRSIEELEAVVRLEELDEDEDLEQDPDDADKPVEQRPGEDQDDD